MNRIDGALGSWPTRDGIDWDAAAERVMAVVRSGALTRSELTVSEAELLEPPMASMHEDARATGPVPRTARAWPRRALSGLAVIGVAAAAAGGLFVVVRHHNAVAPVTVAVTASPARPPPPARTSSPPAPEPISSGVDPSQLAISTRPAPASRSGTPSGPAGGGAGPRRGSGAPVASAVPSTAPDGLGAPGSQEPMQPAAGAAPGSTGLEGAGDTVPLKPSMGAIQGALGSTLPAARACLDADDPVSHAAITFGSDGSAKSVAVFGAAAGKPAEGCIRAALLKAHVPPFAEPAFTAPVTVRPN